MSHNASLRTSLSAVLETPINHYRLWSLTVGCPGCREKRDLRIERHIRDGQGGEHVSAFISRLRCSTCRRMPDTIKLHRANPKVEINLFGPGSY
jgi:hypothetical protein